MGLKMSSQNRIVLLLITLLFLSQSCGIFDESEDRGTLSIVIEIDENTTAGMETFSKVFPEIQDFDRVHCTVTKGGSTVWDNDLTLNGEYFTADITLEEGSGYSVKVDCFENSQLTYTGSQSGISIMGDRTTTVTITLAILSPTDLIATVVSASQIDLSWSDNSVNEEGFVIERKLGTSTAFSPIDTSMVNTTFYQDMGLSTSSEYYYRVYAFDSLTNSAHSNTVSATTLSQYLDIVGSIDTPGDANCVEVYGSYAYIADGSSGLRIFDVSNPESPNEVGFCSTAGNALGLALSGYYVYMACDLMGFRVINVSNLSNPHEVAHCDISGFARAVAVSANSAYVATYSSGLASVWIYNPTNPYVNYNNSTEGNALDLALSGDYVYVAESSVGLGIYSILYLGERGHCYFSGEARGVTIFGSYAYVADGSSGLRIVDVSDEYNPFEVGQCDTPGEANDVAVSGSCAYIADGDMGLRVIDISHPGNLVETGYCDTPGDALGIVVFGDYVYVADGEAGLQIIYIGE